MKRPTSSETIAEYLPIFKRVRTALETRLNRSDLEGQKKLPFYELVAEGCTRVQITDAWQIIDDWIKESGLRAESIGTTFYLVKTDETVSWWVAHDLMAKHIRRQDRVEVGHKKAVRRDTPIEITLTTEGDLVRGQHKHSIREPQRISLMRLLSGAGDVFVKTSNMRSEVRNASEDALRKMIYAINRDAKKHLGIKYNLIEGRSRSGYRINPKYKLARKR